MQRRLAGIAFVLSLASGAAVRAQDDRPPGALDSVLLRSGEVVRGVVLSRDDQGVVLRLRDGEVRTLHPAEVRSVNPWRAAPREASAPMPTVERAVPMTTRSYGGQILLGDALSLGVVVVGASSGIPATALLGLGGYLLAGPIIHGARDNARNGLRSFGLRAGLPVAGFFLGALATQGCHGEYCGLTGAALGVLTGAAVAIAIDAIVLAKVEVPDERPAATLRLAPALFKDGGGLALAVRF